MLREISKNCQDDIENEGDGEEGEDDLEFDEGPASLEEYIDIERMERAVVHYFRAHPPANPDEVADTIENHFLQMEADEIVGEARRERWSDTEEAQELMFRMMGMSLDSDLDEMAALARKALALDPDNADAGTFIATYACNDLGEIAARLRDVVARAERVLGPDIQENMGCLWTNALARPYMRTRYTLMSTLRHAQRWDEAIAEAKAMLELNEDDEQEVGTVLLGLYLASGDTRAARGIMKEYIEQDSALYEWAAVLEKLLSGNKSGATKALATAMHNNPHAAEFLLDSKSIVEANALSDESEIIEEALDCVERLGYAWLAHPEAFDWLVTAAGKGKPRRD
ncbi:MAG: hypothetical protein NTU83_11220 [Candidatus Hydrogenedentes bacterium]|nr:hypothetical protein [Candidatus Hydrogenedentota bacterium]